MGWNQRKRNGNDSMIWKPQRSYFPTFFNLPVKPVKHCWSLCSHNHQWCCIFYAVFCFVLVEQFFQGFNVLFVHPVYMTTRRIFPSLYMNWRANYEKRSILYFNWKNTIENHFIFSSQSMVQTFPIIRLICFNYIAIFLRLLKDFNRALWIVKRQKYSDWFCLFYEIRKFVRDDLEILTLLHKNKKLSNGRNGFSWTS